jgi:hypothetical protein
VHRVGQHRGDNLRLLAGAAAKIKAMFINHFSITFYFSSQNPDKGV